MIAMTASISCQKGEDDPEPEPQPIPTPHVDPTPAPVQTPGKPGAWWKPGPIKSFQIMHFDGLADFKKKLKQVDVVTLELDQIEEAGGRILVDYAHSKGVKVIAYISEGHEKWRSDASQYPEEAKGGAIKCTPLSGGCPLSGRWTGEAWGNPTKEAWFGFMAKRLDRIVAVGADGAEPDNMDQNSNDVGFSITMAQNVAAQKRLAGMAHDRNLAIFQKNALEMSKQLVDTFDGLYNESCHDNEECHLIAPYKNKLVAIKSYEGDCAKVPEVPQAVCSESSDYFE